MHQTKCELIARNGLRCMGCGRLMELHDIQWHHIFPKYMSKQTKQPVDNSYENGSLLCQRCHAIIHRYMYWEEEYQKLTDLILDHKETAHLD